MKSSKSLILLGFVAVLGVGLLVGGIFSFVQKQAFLKTAQKTTGLVTDLIQSYTGAPGPASNSNGNYVSASRNKNLVYYPEVSFTTADGQTIKFQSSTGSNPPAYRRGEKVTILYDPRNPYDASIGSFFQLWFGTIILLGLGVVFTFVGILGLIFTISGNRSREWLLQNGTAVAAIFQKIESPPVISNDRYAQYYIIAQWQNPVDNQIYIFKSNPVFFNPQQYIANQPMRVLIDPKNPKKYYVDLSFLPKVAA